MGSVERAGDAVSDVESGEEEEIVADGELAQHLLKSDVLAAIQGRMFAGNLAVLPTVVKKRVKALKNLQLKVVEIETKFYEEVHTLEVKYMQLYKPFFEKRAEIVKGTYEPKEEECVCTWQEDSEEEELAAGVKGATINEVSADGKDVPPPAAEEKKLDENVKGIPNFWLTIFRNVSMLSEMMQPYDEPIIKHLLDIKVNLMEKEPMGFVLEFHFSPNEYFTNTVLRKEYNMKCCPEEDSPLEFEGPEIFNCKGCEISWNKGRNVTVKTIKKKQKHRSRGSVRTVIKTVQADSFFNFFSPPTMPEDPLSPLIEDVQALLTSDFEIGHYIRERVAPRAVLLFTGEGLDEDDEDYDEEEEEEECSSEESDEEEEPTTKKRSAKAKAPRGQPAPQNPAECKQQ